MSLLLDEAPPARPPHRPSDGDDGGGANPRRWLILAVVLIAQLMVVLDGTIVNIALPDAQAALDMSDSSRQWVVTAYALAFGGLLLLGGRIADYAGRKRAFVIGAGGFAAASALGGVAQSQEMLFGARALQGVFAALLAPAALSILTLSFPSGPDRARAFALYGAVTGGGAAVGLLLGGVLTEYLDWRYTLLVNVPIAIVAAVGALRYIPESRAPGTTKYDVPGALAVTTGLVSLVYGLTEVEAEGWGSAPTLGFLGAGLALLALFVGIERRSTHPLLPLRIPLDRNRGGAYLISMSIGASMAGVFLFLVYYMQTVVDYSAIQSGLATLPITGGVLIAASIAGPVVGRLGPRLVMGGGSLVSVVGMISLAQLSADSSFLLHIMPTEVLFGAGLGLVFIPLTDLATLGVGSKDAGAASALTSASQQVGGSIGLALLNSFYGTAVANYMADHAGESGVQNAAILEGSSVGFYWAGGILAFASVIGFVMIRAKKDDIVREPGVVAAMH